MYVYMCTDAHSVPVYVSVYVRVSAAQISLRYVITMLHNRTQSNTIEHNRTQSNTNGCIPR